MLRPVTTNLGSCIGYAGASTSHDHAFRNPSDNKLNRYNHESFFHGENYRWMITGLNGGYTVATNIIKSMDDFRDLLLKIAKDLTSYSNQQKSRINEQPILSSYNTTKRAQLQVAEAPKSYATDITDLCDEIQPVINEYKEQVDEMYPPTRFRTPRKHYQADEMKRLFKNARSPLQHTLNELKKLSKNRTQALTVLHAAEDEYKNLSRDPTISEKRLRRAHENVTKREDELKEIEDDIASAEKKRDARELVYVQKARNILKPCQQLQKAHSDQITQILIRFSEVISSSECSSKLGMIYQQVISNIKTQQNSLQDLDYWAETNGVNPSTTSSLSITKENDSDDDNDSGVSSTPASTRTRQTRRRSNEDDDA